MAGVKRLLGVSVERVLKDSSSLYGQIAEEDRRLISAAEEVSAREMGVFSAEARFRTPDGRVRWMQMSSSPRLLSNSRILWDGILLDITDRKKAEDELRTSEEKFSRIFHSSSNAMALTKLDTGGIIDVNTCWVQSSGIAREKAFGKTALELGLWIDAADREECLRMLRQEGRFRDYETTLVMESRPLVHLVSAEVIHLAERQYVLWEFRDITERKRIEEALRESEAFRKRVFDSSWIPIVVMDVQELKFIDCNPAAVAIYRFSSLQETLGKTPLDVSAPAQYDGISSMEKARSYIGTALQEGSVVFEWRHRRPNGEIWDAMVHLLSFQSGQTNYLQFTLQDITLQKQLEAQLIQAQKMEAIGLLAGGVAHDFNNILAAMMINLELLQETKSLDQETLGALKELSLGTQRAAGLTRQLLMFSRRTVMDVRVVDLNQVVAHLVKMLGRLLGEHIELVLELGNALPAVEADAGMLEQVLMNLSVNARDAMTNGGRITIATAVIEIDAQQCLVNPIRKAGQFICLAVKDTGCGMERATLQHLFEPFFTTKEKGKGTGLGLATVYGIVTQHRGWVEVESHPGEGSVFRIFLPPSAKEVSEIKADSQWPKAKGHETILLVEDESVVRRMLAHTLSLLGYQVLEACNGREALVVWQNHGQKIDLLFTDMVMPEGLSGLELAQKLRSYKPELRIIISSGYGIEAARESGLFARDYVFVPKPYQASFLGRAVRNCLDQKMGGTEK